MMNEYQVVGFRRAIRRWENLRRHSASANKSFAINLTNDGITLESHESAFEKFEKSLADLKKSLELDPNNAITLENRGITHYIVGNFEESLADLNKLLEINPNNAFALSCRGATNYELDNYEMSLADLSKSLEIESRNMSTIAGKEIYHMIIKYEEALEYFNKSLKIEPNNALELRNRGATLRVLGLYEEKLAKFKKPLENSKENHAKINLKMGRYYEAFADLSKSLEIEPNNADGLKIRGETYYLIGKDAESIEDLNQLLKIKPSDVFALRVRGSAYYMMDKYEESLADLTKALEIDPNYTF